MPKAMLEEIILRKKEDLTLIEDIFYVEKNKRKKIKV